MMRKIRVGEEYVLSKHKPKRLYRYISLLAVLTTMCLYARAQEDIEWTPATSGQSAPVAKELQVGDTVPDELWRKPLILWSAIDNRTKAITLNDYRGKVIILDFWATWCLNCVAYLPHLSELGRQFGSQLSSIPFTLESRSDLWQVFDKKKPIWTNGLEETFQSVVDVSLAEYFPRRTLPHVVVIDQQGTIVAITRPTYLKSEIITGLINGESDSYLPLKRYRLDSPLLEVSSAYADVETHGPLYYSSLSGFIDGVGHSVMWKEDTVARTLRFSISNTFVKKLYLSTKQFGSLPNQHNRTILEVPNPSSMAYLRDSLTDLNRRRRYFYSYESINPLNSDKTAVLQEMKRKLDAYLGLHGRVEKRNVSCVILRRLDGLTAPSKGSEITLKNLVSALNKSLFSLPPVLDETGMESCPKPIFPNRVDPGNIEAIRAMLSDCGLDVTVENRELEMFVLGTRNGPTYTSDQLVLTKYGYVPIN